MTEEGDMHTAWTWSQHWRSPTLQESMGPGRNWGTAMAKEAKRRAEVRAETVRVNIMSKEVGLLRS